MLVFPENSCVCIVPTTRWTFKERVWLFENPSLFLLGGRGWSRPWAMAWWSRQDSSLTHDLPVLKDVFHRTLSFLGSFPAKCHHIWGRFEKPREACQPSLQLEPPACCKYSVFLPSCRLYLLQAYLLSPYQFSCPKCNSVHLSNAGVETVVLGLLWEGNCARCRRKELSSRRRTLRCSEGDKLKCCGLGWEDVQGVQDHWVVDFE